MVIALLIPFVTKATVFGWPWLPLCTATFGSESITQGTINYLAVSAGKSEGLSERVNATWIWSALAARGLLSEIRVQQPIVKAGRLFLPRLLHQLKTFLITTTCLWFTPACKTKIVYTYNLNTPTFFFNHPHPWGYILHLRVGWG